jgi:hypothetical protein
MTIEAQINNEEIYRRVRFQEQVARLQPAPKGYEYKPLNNFGKPILVPETGDNPVIEGTNLTGVQKATLNEVKLTLSILVLSMHEPFLNQRDRNIRSTVILKDQIID